MSKIHDKSMNFQNLWFLDFCEEYNVKIVFYMIRGTRNPSKIQKESMQIRCSKKYVKNMNNYPIWSQNGDPNRWKPSSKWHRFLLTKNQGKIARPVYPAVMYGPPIIFGFHVWTHITKPTSVIPKNIRRIEKRNKAQSRRRGGAVADNIVIYIYI